MSGDNSKKLYMVRLRGLGGSRYNPAYVVAKDAGEAYNKVRNYLDKENIGFGKSREMKTVTLLADNYAYSEVGTLLLLGD